MRTIFAEYNPQLNSIDEPLEYAKLYLDGTMQLCLIFLHSPL